MANVKYIGGYKVESLTDTDTSNRPILNENIYHEYRYSTETLNTKDPLGLQSGKIKVKNNSMGGTGLIAMLLLMIILLFRR